MRYKELEIVIEPNEIEFPHVIQNSIYRQTIHVKNVGNKSKRIQIFRPSIKDFQLTAKTPDQPVPPGLEVTGVIEYIAKSNQEQRDIIVVDIDGKEIQIPLFAFPARPDISIDNYVDFGVHVADNKTVYKTIIVRNSGSIPAPYKIDYKGQYPIGFSPQSAVVQPNSSVSVEVSLLTSSLMLIDDIATLDACHRTHQIQLKGKIMNRRLCLLHPKSDDELQKLNFGACYYGCDLTALAILYNDSPEPVAYSALIDDSKPSDCAHEQTSDREYTLNPLNSIITVFPNQGILNPFEKRPLFFRFSPRAYPPKQAFAITLDLPPRRDIAAFMYFELLGASPGLSNIEHSKTKLEIAVAGTALPVILSIDPQNIQFPTTYIGQKNEKSLFIYNQSDYQSIDFRFPSIANFAVQPASGQLKPREKLKTTVTFIPHQMGEITKTLVCEVLGAVVNPDAPVYSQSKPIHQVQCLLTGQSASITEIPPEKFNMGLKPLIVNEVGININTTQDSLQRFHPRAAVLNSTRDKSHMKRSSSTYLNNFKKHKVSFPNDRARSIGPFNREESFVTPFTCEERYNYVDPDYAYTDDERQEIEAHKNVYNELFHEQRFQRTEIKRTKEFKNFDNNLDLGMKPGNGLLSPHIAIEDVSKGLNKARIPAYPNWKYRLPTTSELAEQEQNLLSRPIKEGLNSVPTTQKEKTDCAILLSPSQLFKVVVGPPELNFGEVCVNAPVTKFLSVLNNLDQFILVQIDVDSPALKMTSPLSQVIPGKSHVQFPITFEPSHIGLYQRSLSYIINNFYRHYVKILADVRLPTVQLSTDKLIIRSLPHLLAEDSFRKVVHLFNPLNAPAEFRWVPVIGPKGTAFSIRPATGVIEPYQTIDCEVVWYGSTLAPLENFFTLHIFSTNDSRKISGNNNNASTLNNETTLTLQCVAQVGKAKLKIPEKRVNFGSIPINMTSKKSFTIVNEGTSHLFFQVVDPNPCPGVVISPANGLVSVGSKTSVTIEVTPIELIKFDIKFGLKVLGHREQEIRMTGDVVEPNLDIPETEFNFNGVPILMKATKPFHIENKGSVPGIVEINLSKYPDFTIETHPPIGNEQCCKKNGQVYSITVQPNESIEAELILVPAEIAFYDFLLPIRTCPPLINVEGLSQASKPQSAMRHKRELSASEQKALQPSHPPIHRRIHATALSDCLQLSTKELHFQMYSTEYNAMKQGAYFDCQEVMLINNSKRKIHWQLDLRNNVTLENDIFRVLHSSLVPFISSSTTIGPEGEIDSKEVFSLKINFVPNKPGTYKTRIPLYVNQNQQTPYTYIDIIGELIMPSLIFEPRRLILPPVPLDIESIKTVRIRSKGFEKNTKLIIVSHVRPIDASYEFHATFVEPAIINIDKQQDFLMKIYFISNHSYSEQIIVKIVDEDRNCFEYEVYVTADNSIFTCYSFLWKSENEYQIVVQPGQIMKGSRIKSDESNSSGEPLLVQRRTATSSNSRPNTSTSATFDQGDQGSDETTTDENISAQNRNERSPTPYARIRSASSQIYNPTTTLSQELNAVSIPYLDNDSKTFQWLVSTLERWYSNQGWPKGTYAVKIPQSFRNALFKRLFETVGSKQNAKEEQKTIYDMITHLSGHSLPGIPQNSVPPKKMDEATKQYLWQHRLLLLFLKTQGSSTAFIRPEYLLPPELYDVYVQMRESALSASTSNEQKDQDFVQERTKPLHLSSEVFEIISKKTWIDVLMQILKSLVLGRVTPRSYEQLGIPDRTKPMPDINTDPTSSNIYGISERILLTWMNYCYSNYREQVWAHRQSSNIPSGRWIVNFDIDLVDSIVLGTVLGAYCPFLIEPHLQRMYVHPTSGEQYLQNALILVSCLLQLGLEYDLQALDITRADPICMCLLVCHLYEHLPEYLSKGTIQFSGILHEPSISQVKITNPSTQTLIYDMDIIGRDAQEFQLVKGTTLSIPAKSTLLVNIQCKNKRLRSTDAVLLLHGRRSNTYPGSAMVFYLQGSIQTITPKCVHSTKKTHRIEAPLYKITKSTIEITNPFNQDGLFQVAIVNSSESTQEMRNPLLTSSEENKQETIEDLFENLQKTRKQSSEEIDCFFIEQTSIELKAHETKQFEVQYIATTAKRREALLVFMNEKIGEFLFLIEGIPKKPEPFPVSSEQAMKLDQKKIKPEKLRFKAVVGLTSVFNIDIPIQNSQRHNALVAVRWQGLNEREREKQTLLGLTNQLPDSSKKSLHPFSRLPEFKVQSSSTTNNFYVPTTLALPLEELTTKLPIRFQADKSGIYSTKLSLSCGNDLREFEIEIHCITQSENDRQTATLYMRTSVFTPIQQNIPIANATDDDWNMTVNFDGHKAFTGPKSFRVEAKSVYQYPLTFDPQVEEDKFQCQMIINNADTGFTQTYNLRGKSDRGPPIGHLQLESKVGSTTTHSIDISNKKSKKTAYYVTCNLPFVQGPPHVCVAPRKTARYEFEICPSKRGTYKGVVVFQPGPWPVKDVDSDGDEIPPLEPDDPSDYKYSLWFTVDINVQRPDPQTTVDLTSPCLSSNSLIIPLRNPLNHSISLSVEFENLPDVFGNQTIDIEANGEARYELIFKPKTVGNWTGGLVFFNDEIGEFWYELNLISTNPKKIELPTMNAPLGGTSTQEITIENPLDEQIIFQTLSSNNNNFIVNSDQEILTIQPKSQTKVNILFNPSSIGTGGSDEQVHQSKISFINNKLGTIKYTVKGVGTKPQKQQSPVLMTTETGVSTTTNVNFQNPANSPIRCDLSITSTNNSFRILLDKLENISLNAREIFHIPIAFCPEYLARHEAQLRVIGRLPSGKTWSPDNLDASDLSWTYPLHGIAFNWIRQRNENDNQLKTIECVINQRTEEHLEFEFNRQLFRFDQRHLNMKKNPMAIENYEIVNENSSNGEFIRNSLGIQLLKRDNEKSDIVRFNLVFTPTKIPTIDCILVLTLATGGQLKYPLRFHTLDAPADDEITLEAIGLNKISTIGFRLYSPTDSPIPYQAYFTSTSDRSFTITPDQGELLPANANGTLLKVSFCPTVYGRTFNGLLIIDTNEYQWKYVVHGVLPHYEPPKNRSSLPFVNNEQFAGQRVETKKRNFILENLQLHQTAISSPIKGANILTKPNPPTSST